MANINKFSPVSPDTYLKAGSDMALAKFGHLNTIVDAYNTLDTAVTAFSPSAGALKANTITESTTGNGVSIGNILFATKTNAITAFAGGSQASAVALTSNINRITTCATIHDSVKLMTATAGTFGIKVINDGAAALDVYPATDDIIGSLTANTPITIPPGRESIFDCAVTGTWSEKRPAPVVAKFTTGTTTGTFTAGQLTGASYVVYNNTQTNPGTINTRTATLMFQDDPTARVGGTYILRIKNGQATGILTVAVGSGVTSTGTLTIAVNTWRDFLVTYTSATALTLQSIGTGTDS